MVLRFLLVVLYCLAVILPHEEVGVFIMGFLEHLPRPEMAKIVLSISIGLTGLLSIPFWLRLRKHPQQKSILLHLGIVLLLVILTYSFLFVLPTETAHFPQYALMAILLFPFTQRFDETMIWAMLVGLLDEGYQYYYLSPERTNYFDFNDVLTDLLGAILGLIFLWPFLKNQLKSPRPLGKSIAWKALGVFVLVALTLYAFAGDGPASIVRVAEEGFWTIVPPGVRFHVLRPLPGLVLVIAVLLAFRKMAFRRDSPLSA